MTAVWMGRVVVWCASCAVALGCASEKAPSWLSTREAIGDTVAVTTTGLPTPPETFLTLRESTSIGVAEGRPEVEFASVADLAVDASGNMYVLDSQKLAVFRFDAAGRFLGAIGRPGQGPGELASGTGVAVRGREVAVHDPRNGRISVFGTDGSFVREVRTEVTGLTGRSLTWMVDGTFALRTWARQTSGYSEPRVVLLSEAGSEIGAIVPLPYPPPPLQEASRGGAQSVVPVPDVPLPFISVGADGSVVRGNTGQYALEVGGHGRSPTRIVRDGDALPLSRSDRSNLREVITSNWQAYQPGWRWSGADVPRDKPRIRDVWIDYDGRLWVKVPMRSVRRQRDPHGPPIQREWREPTAFEVFGRDGSYLGAVRTSEDVELLAAKGTDVWGLGSGKDGEPVVRRYSVVAWR